MSKLVKIAILEGLILIILLLLFLLPLFPKTTDMAKVCFTGKLVLGEQGELKSCFDVEIAKTVAEQKRGLMFKKSLEESKGMLFVFEKEGNYPFWMKNTLIPLDIIWINQNQEIVFIAENAQPCQEICNSINPNQNAKYALEINGGTFRKLGLKINDRISISY